MIKFSMKKMVLILGVCISANSFAFPTTHDPVPKKSGMTQQGKSHSGWDVAMKRKATPKKQRPSVNPFSKQAKGGMGKIFDDKKKKKVLAFLKQPTKRPVFNKRPLKPQCGPRKPVPSVHVPEPATLGLIGVGLVGLAFSRRYNKA